MQPWCAAPQHIQNVTNRRTARGRHDSDSLRKFRQRSLAGRIEKSLGIEFAFERIELRLQNAQTDWLNDLDAELILSARFEDGNVSVNLDLRSISEWLSERSHGVSKNHASDLRPRVFQSEVLMTAGMQFVIGNFALHPDRAEPGFERTANAARQFGDGKDFCRCLKKISRDCHVERSRDISKYFRKQ